MFYLDRSWLREGVIYVPSVSGVVAEPGLNLRLSPYHSTVLL